MTYRIVQSPIGPLLLAGDDRAVRHLSFAAGRRGVRPDSDWRSDDGALDGAATELAAYFAGGAREFRVPVAPQGTPFQQRVWSALQQIPYGETISYRDLARRIGQPEAVRAVGLANGANPIAIIIPCHRVIGSDGSLVGYGGGLPIKQALLALERGQTRLL